MSAAIKQLCRGNVNRMKSGLNGNVFRLFMNDTRYLSYLNGNRNIKYGNNCQCFSSNCNCYQLHKNRIEMNKYCFCSTSQQREASNNQNGERQNENEKENEENNNENVNNNENEEMLESDASDNDNALEEKIDELTKQVAQFKDIAARAQADLLNFDAMSKRDIEKAKKYSVKKFSKDVLSVADALRGAIDAIEKENLENDEKTKALVDGVKLTQRSLLESFEKNGITLMECDGKDFNPNYHEALFQVSTNDHSENAIVNVVTQGYFLHDQVLRPAKVAIAKPLENSNDKENESNQANDEKQ